ncbi:MAG: hypothetical protein LBH21_01625 [Gracilibacteraceae bacterium]|jgi:hypothetical protein|nr:hypothetical protein [Gracilibacteraceae bacterium]
MNNKPILQINDLLKQNGAGIAEAGPQLGIICLWALGACLLVAAAYKRQILDDGGTVSKKNGVA